MARSVFARVPREAAVLLEDLQAIPFGVRVGWWARRERRKRVSWHLLHLSVLQVPAACPALLAWVTDPDRRIREWAAHAFVSCASSRPAAVALALEALDSPLGGYGDASGSVDDAGSYGWVAYCLSRDGFRREQALRRLTGLGSPQPLAFVLVRLNDWVPQVRRAALEAARAVLVPRFARAWVLAWPILDHLERCGRVDRLEFDELVEDARRMLAAAWNGGAIEEGMRSDDSLVRRAAWRLALEAAPTESARELLADALAANDVVVARRAAILAGRTDDPELRALRLAHHDPVVRRIALRDHPVDDREALERALEPRLLDRHGGVRVAAAYLWRKRLGRDAAEFYRERLDDADPRVVERALAGLASEGGADDASRAEPWLDAEGPRLRAAAFDLATRAAEPSPALRRALLDPSRHVRDVARRRLRLPLLNGRDRLDAELLLPALDPALPPGPAALALSLADRAGRWEGLAVALAALGHPEARVAARARRVARRALDFPGGGVAMPTASQRARIEATLESLDPDPLVHAARALLARTET